MLTLLLILLIIVFPSLVVIIYRLGKSQIELERLQKLYSDTLDREELSIKKFMIAPSDKNYVEFQISESDRVYLEKKLSPFIK